MQQLDQNVIKTIEIKKMHSILAIERMYANKLKYKIGCLKHENKKLIEKNHELKKQIETINNYSCSSNIYTIKINKVYSFFFKETDFKFPLLSSNEICKLIKTKSSSSLLLVFIQEFIDKKFGKYKGLQHNRLESQSDSQLQHNRFDSQSDLRLQRNRFDLRLFTENGCTILPKTKGFFNEFKFLSYTKNRIFILCNIRYFPKIDIVFKNGEDLSKEYTNGKIHTNQEKNLFN